jgi:hypothetical protein
MTLNPTIGDREMKTLRRIAINALVYLVTIALIFSGIAILAAGEMASILNDIWIAATGLAAMMCVRCRLEGKPFGPPLVWTGTFPSP